MKINFILLGEKAAKNSSKGLSSYFKINECHSLFRLYADRTKHYRTVESQLLKFENFLKLLEGESKFKILTCDLGKHAKSLTSDEIAHRFNEWEIQGYSLIFILLGPPNGFSEAQRQILKQKGSLFLNFGAQTLPHDIAAVIAAEQTYRAYTILKGEPYHLGH